MSSLPLSALYVKYTGQKPRRSGREFLFLAPCHDDHEPSFSINDEKDLAYCFSCNQGYNRESLLKLLGVPKTTRKKSLPVEQYRHTGNDLLEVKRPVLGERLENTLRLLGDNLRANKLYNCGRFYQEWKCLIDDRHFPTPIRCHDPLCPTCGWQQVDRFLKAHEAEIDYDHGYFVVDVHFPGIKAVDENGLYDPYVVRRLLQEKRAEWQRLRHRFNPVGHFVRDLQSFTFKIKKGVCWITMNLLLDAAQRHIELLKGVYAQLYPWRPVRLAREFSEKDAALAWFKERADRGFTEWETPRDLECYLVATKGLPVIMSHGLKKAVKGGKGRAPGERAPEVTCPYCGSSKVVRCGLIPREQVTWERGFPEIAGEKLAPGCRVKDDGQADENSRQLS